MSPIDEAIEQRFDTLKAQIKGGSFKESDYQSLRQRYVEIHRFFPKDAIFYGVLVFFVLTWLILCLINTDTTTWEIFLVIKSAVVAACFSGFVYALVLGFQFVAAAIFGEAGGDVISVGFLYLLDLFMLNALSPTPFGIRIPDNVLLVLVAVSVVLVLTANVRLAINKHQRLTLFYADMPQGNRSSEMVGE